MIPPTLNIEEFNHRLKFIEKQCSKYSIALDEEEFITELERLNHIEKITNLLLNDIDYFKMVIIESKKLFNQTTGELL